MESLTADVRFALRYFARTPLTTLTIVLVLALGVGVNSALFSVLQSVTMRPAPAVPTDDAHVRIWGLERRERSTRWEVRAFSHAEVRELAARRTAFSDVAAWMAHDVIIAGSDGAGSAARGIRAEFVTPNYWATLGVGLVTGPGFAPRDEDGADLSAVLSFPLANELFAAPSGAIGQRIVVNDLPVRIVGVSPPRFQGAIGDNGRPQLWLPVSARAAVARTSPRWLDGPALSVFARLAPSVTAEQATVIAHDVAARQQPDSATFGAGVRTARVLPLRALPPAGTADDPFVAFVAVGVIALLILLVACTNVGSLLVAAAVARRHEIAVRLSLGATRARVLRQLLTESVLLAVTGAMAGLLLCWWVLTFLASRVHLELAPDPLTVAFTMAFAMATGLLFGLSPALHATRAGEAVALRDSASGLTGRSRLMRSFVIAQIVFTQPLLVLLAVVLAQTVHDVAPRQGMTTDRIMVAAFRPLSRTGPATQRQEAVDSLALRLAAAPGIARVLPDASTFATSSVSVPPRAGGDVQPPTNVRVSVEGAPPGYFELLDVPIVLGRDLEAPDTIGTALAVVISTGLARGVFGDANPIGRTLASLRLTESFRALELEGAPPPRQSPEMAMVVVGVFDDRYATTRDNGERVYTAHGKRWRRDVLLIRTQGSAAASTPLLQSLIRADAPGLPLTRLATLAEVGRGDRREARQIVGASAAAAALALLVASIGLFAVVSLAVGQRTREIGIRIALGGRPLRVAGSFFLSGVRLTMLGLLIGLPTSVIALRIATSEGIVLAREMPLPMLGACIALVVLIVSGAAAWLPARRAATVDPALTLRAE